MCAYVCMRVCACVGARVCICVRLCVRWCTEWGGKGRWSGVYVGNECVERRVRVCTRACTHACMRHASALGCQHAVALRCASTNAGMPRKGLRAFLGRARCKAARAKHICMYMREGLNPKIVAHTYTHRCLQPEHALVNVNFGPVLKFDHFV
jgi:hypothetical protein